MQRPNLHKITCFGELKNPLLYCKDSGKLYRLQTGRGTCKGLNEIKATNNHGYLWVGVSGKLITVHQLVAMEFLDHKPSGYRVVVDHIDGDKLNNRISNLQVVSQRVNVAKGKLYTNKTSGLPLNVYFNKQASKFEVRFRFNGRNVGFGLYSSLESAVIARDEVQTRVVENGESLEGFRSELVTAKKFKQ